MKTKILDYLSQEFGCDFISQLKEKDVAPLCRTCISSLTQFSDKEKEYALEYLK